MKKILNIGVVAHVDAGKTTVSEHFLYHGGVLGSIGRVDHGDTKTDSLKVEQDRGITVKATTVSFTWNDVKINLIDTPGHVDFVAEVERSLQVLDGAILVISAKEGVQAQTRVLYDTLKRLKIPTIIFINKLDRSTESIDQLYKEINNQLDMKSVFMQKVENYGDNITLTPWEHCIELVEKNLEQVIDSDINLLDSYLKGVKDSHSRIRTLILKKVKSGEISPVFHGIALKGIGIVELLDGIVKLIENDPKNHELPLSGVVYKIDRDRRGVRQVYFRIFQGSIRLRDTIKIKNIGKPTLKTKVIPVHKGRRQELIKVLYEIMEEDPLLQCEIDSTSGEISVSLFGEVQKEILEYIIREKYNIEAQLSETSVIFKERIKKVVYKTINLGEKLNPYRAGISFKIEPLEVNTGLIYETKVSYGELQNSYQKAIYEGIKKGLEGIYGWEVTDIKVTLIDMEYDSVTSTPADYRNLAAIVLREAIGEAGTEILEPLSSFKLIVPKDAIGRAVSELKVMRGDIKEITYKNDEIILTGVLPIDTSRTYSIVVAGYTEGRGVFTTKFYGYKRWKGNIVMRKGIINDLFSMCVV